MWSGSHATLSGALPVTRPSVLLSAFNAFSAFTQNSFKHLIKQFHIFILDRIDARTQKVLSIGAPGLVPPADERVSQICDAALPLPACSCLCGRTEILHGFPRATFSCSWRHNKPFHTILIFLHRLRLLPIVLPWASFVFVARLGVQLSMRSGQGLLVFIFLPTVWRWEGGGSPLTLQSEVKNIRLASK